MAVVVVVWGSAFPAIGAGVAAYDPGHLVLLRFLVASGLLLAHARFFSVLPLSGLILTHLDEETRWSKCWNLVLATQLPILYLSGGQNIPGDFRPALPDEMFDKFVEAGREQMDEI